MAVKKHIFDQYISDQESLSALRGQRATHQRYSHNRVFDEPQSLKKTGLQNGSQTIHNKESDQFTHNIGNARNGSQTVHKNESNHPAHNIDGAKNGSQTVHENELDHPTRNIDNARNGSQTVHENELDQPTYNIDNARNGSQTVHKNEPDHPTHNIDGGRNGSQTVHENEPDHSTHNIDGGRNGSQTVHESELDQPIYNIDNARNGSQTVHKNEPDHPTHNIDGGRNGSQTVHENEPDHSTHNIDSGGNGSQAVRESELDQPTCNIDNARNGSQTVHENEPDHPTHNIDSGRNGSQTVHESEPGHSTFDTDDVGNNSQIPHAIDDSYSPAETCTQENSTQVRYALGTKAPCSIKALEGPTHNILNENFKTNHNRANKYAARADINLVEKINAWQSPIPNEATNGSQTVHAGEDNTPYFQRALEANGSQTIHQTNHKRFTNGSQTIQKSETVHKRYTKPITNGSRTVHETSDVSSLPQIQRELLKALYANAKINGDRTTQRLNIMYIAELSGIKKTSLKNTLWRLRNIGFLNTKEYKDGRGGWVSYEIPKSVYLELTAEENGSQTVHKRFTQPTTKPTTYSSSSNIINTTTTGNGAFLPAEWAAIDCEQLADMGFQECHIKMLFESGNTSPQRVQESIDHCAWGKLNRSEYYKEKYKNLLAVFLGTLKKGVPWVESGFRSQKAIALKELLEAKKNQKSSQDELVNEFMKIEFPIWRNSQSEEDLVKIQRSGQNKYNSFQESATEIVRKYFKKNILLPELKAKGLIENYDSSIAELEAMVK